MARFNDNDRLGNELYEIADALGDDSPRIGDFRVADGLKALAVGLSADSTAECLHGRAMSGIYKTLSRIGRGLVKQNMPNCAVTPLYKTAERADGSTYLVLEPVEITLPDGSTQYNMEPVKEKLTGFGFAGLAVYTTCMVGSHNNAGGPEYTHSALFSDTFFARGLDIYLESPHCRAGDFPFHMEIIRGQLAMWAASRNMPNTSIAYSQNLLELAEERDVDTMVRTFTQDLKDAKLAEFVLA